MTDTTIADNTTPDSSSSHPTAQDHAGRICVVTGASRGIGYSAALELARRGAHIVAIARTQGGLEELDDEINAVGSKASLIVGDINNADAMSRLGDVLQERFGRMDSFIANAAILGELTPLTDVPEDVWNDVITTNLTAQWRLTKVLDPLLRLSNAGRVLYLSSSVAISPRAYWGPYAVSKAGLEALALTYADEVTQTSIRVNTLNPGGTRTKMRAKAMPGEIPDTVPHPREIAPLIAEMTSPYYTAHGTRVNFQNYQKEDIA